MTQILVFISEFINTFQGVIVSLIVGLLNDFQLLFYLYFDPIALKQLLLVVNMIVTFYLLFFQYIGVIHQYTIALNSTKNDKGKKSNCFTGIALFGAVIAIVILIQGIGNGSIEITKYVDIFVKQFDSTSISEPSTPNSEASTSSSFTVRETVIDDITYRQIQVLIDGIIRVMETQSDLNSILGEDVDEATKELSLKIFNLAQIDLEPFKNGNATDQDYHDALQKLKGLSSSK